MEASAVAEVLEALAATPQVLAGVVAGVPLEVARAARGGDEGWSVVAVVCHLRDAELFGLGRMRAIRDGEQASISGYDQMAWAQTRRYDQANLDRALTAFSVARAAHVAALAILTPAEWAQVGLHQKHGPVTLWNHTLHTLWHDAVHLGQIVRQLEAQ